MAIKKTKVLVKDPVSVVYEGDPNVTLNRGINGLGELSEAQFENGAEILELRVLDIFQRAQVDAIDQFRPKNLKRAILGLVSVSTFGDNDSKGVRRKITDPEELLAWLNDLEDDSVWILIGGYVKAITKGEDPQDTMRAYLSREKLAPEVAPTTETKSGEEGSTQA